MRVTYIQQHFALQSEPGFVRAWEFCRRLVEEGHDVTVVRGAAESSVFYDGGVRIISVKAPYENEMRFRRRIVSFAQFAILATVRSVLSRPQLVYASSTPLTVVIPGAVASILNRSRFFFEVRDLWPAVPRELGLVKNPIVLMFAEALERFAYHRAERVIALSPDMADGVKRVSPLTSVEVVPNGCDMDEFDQIEPDVDSIRAACSVPVGGIHIVYAGGFGFMYDLPWVIDLAARLFEDGVYFTLIGRGTESDNLLQQARAKGVFREGMFPGRLPKREVIKYLKSSDVMLSALRDAPALEACSLNKVFDAMAARRPLILNHDGWLTEEVCAVGSGWRISRDLDTAAAQVRALVKDPAGLIAAGHSNRRLGESKFHREDQYLRFRGALFSE